MKNPSDVIRLYDENGNHCLSIVTCDDAICCGKLDFDLTIPGNDSDKVVYCGIPKDLVEVFAENMVVESH